MEGDRVSPEDVAREYIRSSGGADPWADAYDLEATQRRRRLIRNAAIVLVVLAIAAGAAIVLVGRHKTPSAASPPASSASSGDPQATANRLAIAHGCPASPATPPTTVQYAAPGNMLRDNTLYAATVVTTAGTFRIALTQSTAPKSVNSFIFLAEKGYFTCNTFNRVVANGIDATGDPSGTADGGPGYTIPAEQPAVSSDPAHQYAVGTVALANNGYLDAGGSQWFVVTGPIGESLPRSFSVLGRVISGMSVVDKINADGSVSGRPQVIERILKVTIQVKTL